MPQIFKVGSYWVYFWANENKPLEPVHVRISQGGPRENAPKLWITSRGKCIPAGKQTEIPDKVFRNIAEVVEARSDFVIAKWIDFFGEARFYC